MTDLPTNVRIAVPADAERLYQFLRMVHAENSLAALDETKVRNMISYCLEKKRGVVGIIQGETCIEGAMGMLFSEWWYSTETHLEEIWNFVHPSYRKTAHAKTLIDFGKHCAETFNMPLLIGVLSNSRTKAKVKLYERSLPNVGATFLYVPPGLEEAT